MLPELLGSPASLPIGAVDFQGLSNGEATHGFLVIRLHRANEVERLAKGPNRVPASLNGHLRGLPCKIVGSRPREETLMELSGEEKG